MKIKKERIVVPSTGVYIGDAYTAITSWGGKAVLLDINSSLKPQETATIQAMASRSHTSLIDRINALFIDAKIEGAVQRIVADNQKGYGHKSINDLGNMLMYFEDVSMLAAKAIQDHQLYNGQESSTRYIDFTNQPFIYEDKDGKIRLSDDESLEGQLLEDYRKFYVEQRPKVIEYLKELYPIEEQPEGTKIQDYNRAINARAFDIIRGFLPAGCTTNVAWWSSLSNCTDHIGWMRCHPLNEVKELAKAVQLLGEKVYPHVFKDRPVDKEQEKYKRSFMKSQYYLDTPHLDKYEANFVDLADFGDSEEWKHQILKRPKRQELHYTVGEAYNVALYQLLDFASFRDVQRHRPVTQRHGLLRMNKSFHPWYLSNLPNTVRDLADEKLTLWQDALNESSVSSLVSQQYLVPMGYRVQSRITGPLGKIIYMIEQRCQTTVHPTLHANVYAWSQRLKSQLAYSLCVNPDEIPLYINPNVGEFSLKRGQADMKVGGREVSSM